MSYNAGVYSRKTMPNKGSIAMSATSKRNMIMLSKTFILSILIFLTAMVNAYAGSFNGSGTFVRSYNWVNDATNSIPITASRFDTEDNGFATGLSTCITKDGQQTITNNIPFNNFRITGLGDPTGIQDAVTANALKNGKLIYGQSVAGTNTITFSTNAPITAYAAGQMFVFQDAVTNTGAVTVNVDGVGAQNLKYLTAAGLTALPAGYLIAAQNYLIVYDGTQFELFNPNLNASAYEKLGGMIIDDGSGNLTVSASAALPNGVTATTQALGDTTTKLATDAFAQNAVNALINTPQGRLTLTSNVPVMTGDATAQTAIYYTPYDGNNVPIYNGTSFVNNTFSQLTLTLNTTNMPTSEVFDVYVSLQSSTPTLCAMYWGGNTARSTTLGGKSGAANASVTQLNGIWVNNAAIATSNCYNNTTPYAIAQNQGTLLGTFYTTANGQTGMQFKPAAASGGANGFLGLWNAYNRVRINSISQDSTATWSYSTNTWRAANGNNSNRISYVDGLQQSSVYAYYQAGAAVGTASISSVGIDLDSNSGTPTGVASYAGGSISQTLMATVNFSPQLGFHFLQAMEIAAGSTTFQANSIYQELLISLEM